MPHNSLNNALLNLCVEVRIDTPQGFATVRAPALHLAPDVAAALAAALRAAAPQPHPLHHAHALADVIDNALSRTARLLDLSASLARSAP